MLCLHGGGAGAAEKRTSWERERMGKLGTEAPEEKLSRHPTKLHPCLTRSSDDIFHDSINSRKPHPGKLSLVPSSAGHAGKGQCSTHNPGILLSSAHSDPGWLRCAENSSASFLVQGKQRKGAWVMLRSLHGLPRPIFAAWVHPAHRLYVLAPQVDLWYSG